MCKVVSGKNGGVLDQDIRPLVGDEVQGEVESTFRICYSGWVI